MYVASHNNQWLTQALANRTESQAPRSQSTPAPQRSQGDGVAISRETEDSSQPQVNFGAWEATEETSPRNAGNARSEARRTQRNASAVYRRHGNQVHNLGNRREVGRLISRTPQLDNNNSGTQNDGVRCGGAALMNALLLDGDNRANARAIRALADPQRSDRPTLDPRTADGHTPFRMTQQQRSALNAMDQGNLTPNQTSHLQEMLFQMTDGVQDGSQPNDRNNDGVTTRQMDQMVNRLTNAGAFPNTRELNMRMDDNGNGGYHWTTTSTNNHGTQHADSWPANNREGHDGYASVQGVSNQERGDFVYQGGDPGTFAEDVTMRRGGFGQGRVSSRQRAQGSDEVRNVRFRR